MRCIVGHMTDLGIGAGMAIKGAAGAGKALSGGKAEQAVIQEIAKGSSGAQVAGNAMGARMAAKQMAINRLLTPLFRFAGLRQEYFNSGKFAEDLAARMAGVPEENLISPAPNVAAQAMEGLSYSLDQPDLRGMYLNLLSTASDSRRAGDAHPSYADVIRQLSGPEAGLLPQFLVNRVGEPMVEIRLVVQRDGKEGYVPVERHVVEMHSDDVDTQVLVENWPAYVDNWRRLGLVETDYIDSIMREGAYDFVEARPEYLRHPASEGQRLEIKRGLLVPTDFGRLFGKAVNWGNPPPNALQLSSEPASNSLD